VLCKQERYFLTISNYIFTVVFALEMLVKVSFDFLISRNIAVVLTLITISCRLCTSVFYGACQQTLQTSSASVRLCQ